MGAFVAPRFVLLLPDTVTHCGHCHEDRLEAKYRDGYDPDCLVKTISVLGNFLHLFEHVNRIGDAFVTVTGVQKHRSAPQIVLGGLLCSDRVGHVLVKGRHCCKSGIHSRGHLEIILVGKLKRANCAIVTVVNGLVRRLVVRSLVEILACGLISDSLERVVDWGKFARLSHGLLVGKGTGTPCLILEASKW